MSSAEQINYIMCGSFHVEKAALLIAILNGLYYADLSFNPSFSFGILYIFFALVHLSIIVAQKKRNPSFYLPYLIVQAIGLLLSIMFLDLLIIAPTFAIGNLPPELKLRTNAEGTNFHNVLAVALIIGMDVWFYTVVYQAYKFMKEQPAQGQPNVAVGGRVQMPV